MKRLLLLFCLALTVTAFSQTEKIDVLVIGGGAGGTAAGIQAARLGAKTLIVEEGPWLGGMLSAAGVSAIDGNHELPSGIWGEFRSRIYAHYGGPSKVNTGWVSSTLFEPHIADSILKAMVKKELNLKVIYGYSLTSVTTHNGAVKGATFKHKQTGKELRIEAKQTIDATEMGDVMAMAKVPYSLGMEAGSETGETVGVHETNDIVQDLTYVGILKDYGMGRDCTIVKPAGYDPHEFDGSSTSYYLDKSRKQPNVDAQKMLDYGKLPNGKYMLNWPIYGNDSYMNIVEMNPEQREKEIDKAKQVTFRFIYFIQHELGFKHLGLTIDEFPTADRLALMPYYREGRRLKGILRFNMNQIANPFKQNLYRTGISVGDYPIDHHHKKNLQAPQQLEFYPVPSYNIPLAALIPESVDGLIVAEKGISVTNVVNGTTRLQPVVILTGQAAGLLAALASKNNIAARHIKVREVQKQLLETGAYIMPYNDVKPGHPYFKSIQRIGATGILKGKPTPHTWANQTWFYPDSLVNAATFVDDLKSIFPVKGKLKGPNVSIADISLLMQPVARDFNVRDRIQKNYKAWGLPTATASHLLTRGEMAKMLDELFQPFNKDVDHLGNLK